MILDDMHSLSKQIVEQRLKSPFGWSENKRNEKNGKKIISVCLVGVMENGGELFSP